MSLVGVVLVGGREQEEVFLCFSRSLSEVPIGDVDSVKTLVQVKGIDVNAADGFGCTALMYAVKKFENLVSGKQPQYICEG